MMHTNPNTKNFTIPIYCPNHGSRFHTAYIVRVQGSRTCASAVPPTNISRQQIPSSATKQLSSFENCHVVANKLYVFSRLSRDLNQMSTAIITLWKQNKHLSMQRRRQTSSSMQNIQVKS